MSVGGFDLNLVRRGAGRGLMVVVAADTVCPGDAVCGDWLPAAAGLAGIDLMGCPPHPSGSGRSRYDPYRLLQPMGARLDLHC